MLNTICVSFETIMSLFPSKTNLIVRYADRQREDEHAFWGRLGSLYETSQNSALLDQFLRCNVAGLDIDHRYYKTLVITLVQPGHHDLDKETLLVTRYREAPEMQVAINKILGMV